MNTRIYLQWNKPGTADTAVVLLLFTGEFTDGVLNRLAPNNVDDETVVVGFEVLTWNRLEPPPDTGALNGEPNKKPLVCVAGCELNSLLPPTTDVLANVPNKPADDDTVAIVLVAVVFWNRDCPGKVELPPKTEEPNGLEKLGVTEVVVAIVVVVLGRLDSEFTELETLKRPATPGDCRMEEEVIVWNEETFVPVNKPPLEEVPLPKTCKKMKSFKHK